MISGSIRTGAVSLTAAAVVVAASLAPLGAQEDRDSVYAALFHSLGLQERVAEPEPKIAPRLPATIVFSPCSRRAAAANDPRETRVKKDRNSKARPR